MRVRRVFGLGQAAHVVTQRMMAEYAALASRPRLEDRLAGLDAWLARYGHRGPLESDPVRPRFHELREVLRADLARGAAPEPAERPQPTVLVSTLVRPLFWLDEVRESFRDRLMRWWDRLRARVLEASRAAVAAGTLDDVDDVFYLRSDDLVADPATWRAVVARRRSLVAAARGVDLPATAPRDAIEAALSHARRPDAGAGPDRFVGIGLGQQAVLGTAVRAREVTAVLNGVRLPESPVLVVDTLEPSWAVVFPRFAAVVAELGGELSHASILLREAGISAVVNAHGAFHSIADGDLVRVDPASGEVCIEPRPASSNGPAAPP
jgi:pyruvate,water dikinase